MTNSKARPIALILLLGLVGASVYGAATASTSAAPATPTAALNAPAPAPVATKRANADVDFTAFQERLLAAWQRAPGRRGAVTVDRPLYKPGETIWVQSWELRDASLGDDLSGAAELALINPKGAAVQTARPQRTGGISHANLEIGSDAPGGRYLVRLSRNGQTITERPVIVAGYETPRVQKKLEFVRKAYGPGDEVSATISVQRANGDALAKLELVGQIHLDGQELPPVKLTTNAAGEGLVRFTLPQDIAAGDGLLTVLVADGGVTESISRPIPITLNRVDLGLFPEGGELLLGLPGRVYVEARTPLGKPADVEGRVVDDRGQTVTSFKSVRDGRGRFELNPQPGRSYRVELDKPAGIAATTLVPGARREGCNLRSYDDFDSQIDAIRVGVRCSTDREVSVQAVLRENLLDGATVKVTKGAESTVWLRAKDPALRAAQGAARVTVFDGEEPLAERLIYRNRRSGLNIEVSTDKERYSPREKVTLTVRTSDAAGQPVPANLALSVVDSTLLSYADDKEGHLLSQLYLAPELAGELEEPNWYFDAKNADAAEALDMVMGTRGWRRFDWQTRAAPPPPPPPPAQIKYKQRTEIDFDDVQVEADMVRPEGAVALEVLAAPPRDRAPAKAGRAQLAPQAPKAEAAPVAATPPAPVADAPAAEPVRAPVAGAALADGLRKDRKQLIVVEDAEIIINPQATEAERRQFQHDYPAAFTPVRVFPAPIYKADYDGPRTDFRDTLHWAPELHTDASGKAELSFYTSDAITSFRVTTEGVGGGLAGHSEQSFASVRPFSMSAKLPVAVSEGDRIDLPITFENETDRGLKVNFAASLGDLLELVRGESGALSLDAGGRATREVSVLVKGKQGQAPLSFTASAQGLNDALSRELTVSPLGFPQLWERSGELAGSEKLTVDLGKAIPGTFTASVSLYPSPVATMTGGLEGMLREPGGCFEQTSSSNYPNVMILSYLSESDAVSPELLNTTRGMIERGYGRLTGYETKDKGYEWFGATPAHEALTAYGLVEFKDMAKVFEGVDQSMIRRTGDWLLSRRDGKGGYKHDSKALDSFGRASDDVTDAYITWSLTEAQIPGIDKEIAALRQRALSSKDAYIVALAAGALTNAHDNAAHEVVARLLTLQDKDGAWRQADHSITRSTGENLHIETTALAVLALLHDGNHRAQVDSAVKWLNANRGGYGQWGATQATVLALSAMTEYSKASRVTRGAGTVELRVNGKVAGHFSYEAGHQGAIDLGDFGAYLTSGKNTIELSTTAKDAMPYSMALSYRASLPATAPDALIGLSTSLAKNELRMGETTRLTATIKNLTKEGQPMTVARIGLPGGLSAQSWQLEDLRKSGAVAFYETGPREVIVYFRDMAPDAESKVPLDLVADVPGSYTAPASSAYLYYSNDKKYWVEGEKVSIKR